MSADTILIVDDEPSIHRLLEYHLRRQQCRVASAGTLAEAEARLGEERFTLLLLDYTLPDGSGLEFLKKHRGALPATVVMSAHGNAETAISCIRAGALDYIIKPFALEELDQVIERARGSLPAPALRPVLPEANEAAASVLAGDSAGIARVRELMAKVAPTETPVLIRGEAGTGKQRLAEALHRASGRAAGPFLKLNCGVGAPERIEAELFGDPEAARCGLIELADGGTLLLEEVSELPQRVQVALLRVLQERQFQHPGSGACAKANVRLLATTQRDLAQQVAQGGFRQDLFFRLSVFPIAVPALRERTGDLPLLAKRWLENFGCRNSARMGGISEEALRRLAAYPWPGNLRELENALERAVILTGFDRCLESSAFEFLSAPSPALRSGPCPEEEPLLTLNELEKRHVLKALEYTNQNRTRAAGLLKISVRTLRNKLHQYRQEDGGLPGTALRPPVAG